MELKKFVVIIGGGWSGIGVAESLAYNSFDDYVLLEQTDCFGGFWKYNTYDSVRMHDLSRLFKTPHDLSEKYKDHFLLQSEVPIYLQQYAEYHGIPNHTILGFKVTRIFHKTDEEFCWKVTGIHLAANVETTYHRKILIIGDGHSASEISTELADAGFHVTIAYRSGQYFMRQQDWTPYLSNQTIEKSLEFWKYSMADENFNEILDRFNEKFSEKIYHINHEINWAIPSLKPASFIVSHKKTFIDDDHFFDLMQQKLIEIKGSVREIVGEGVIFDQKLDAEEFDGIILCTGLSSVLEQFLDDANQYLSNHRYLHLPPEKSRLPITDGRCKSATKNNLYFPGFDYGINQRVDFALYSWYIGERILDDIMGNNFTPELSRSKFKLEKVEGADLLHLC
ncbi:unnamed protein product [Rotaria socialis]|uniref:Flavin-containing monooxygenase n=1 Tax=Rotaria socialis TaxID=392032 RepID=A0A817UU51_9BILA|nr:unnamed protein product [Rotaria socialis]CAF4377843.1 unnamed protein product [Rotaria socialis]